MTGENLITLLDTATASENLGDEIIMDACRRHLRAIFPDAFFVSSATHAKMTETGLRHAARSRHVFMCGTNILSSRPHKGWQFGIHRKDIMRLRNVTLLGTGWTSYADAQKKSFIAPYIYRHILAPETVHSVRDNFAKATLERLGVSNSLCTGCPTLWDLTDNVVAAIPAKRAQHAVVTITDYHRDEVLDASLLTSLAKLYDKVLLWPQGSGDAAYVRTLNAPQPELLPPDLSAFDAVLQSDMQVDYVGTRLHGGIRAMAHARRALIVAIDLRAAEMAKDFGLWIMQRSDVPTALHDVLASDHHYPSIGADRLGAQWASQFGGIKEPLYAVPQWRRRNPL